MSNDKSLFLRPVHVHEIPASGRHFNITTTEPEREAVARQLGLPGIAELGAKLVVKPFGKEGLAVEGTIHARVIQTCVVSAEDFENTVEAPVEIRFSPDGRDPNADFDLAELNDPDAEDPPDLLTGSEVDLGAVIAEFLALALDPYPRKPGVAFEAPGADSSLSPFDALKALKSKDH